MFWLVKDLCMLKETRKYSKVLQMGPEIIRPVSLGSVYRIKMNHQRV